MPVTAPATASALAPCAEQFPVLAQPSRHRRWPTSTTPPPRRCRWRCRTPMRALRAARPRQHPPRRAHAEPARHRRLRAGAQHSSALSAPAPITNWCSPRAPPRRSTWWPMACRTAGHRSSRLQPATRSSSAAWSTTPTCVPWQQAARRSGARCASCARCPGAAACRPTWPPAGSPHPRVRADRLRQRHRRAPALRGPAGPGSPTRAR
jgi:hypothetical protein